MPTFLGYSEEAVSVNIGGFTGYGGVMLHEPTEDEFHLVSNDVDEDRVPKGIGFNYFNVATVTISGLLKWTNRDLSRAPKGRQDVRDTGPVRIEVFDEEELREYVERNIRLFDRLGIKFVG